MENNVAEHGYQEKEQGIKTMSVDEYLEKQGYNIKQEVKE